LAIAAIFTILRSATRPLQKLMPRTA